MLLKKLILFTLGLFFIGQLTAQKTDFTHHFFDGYFRHGWVVYGRHSMAVKTTGT
mgnify:CR=1 FL=1